MIARAFFDGELAGEVDLGPTPVGALSPAVAALDDRVVAALRAGRPVLLELEHDGVVGRFPWRAWGVLMRLPSLIPAEVPLDQLAVVCIGIAAEEYRAETAQQARMN